MLFAAASLLAATAAFAQKPNIYSCDVNGRRVVSQAPIAECSSREQRILRPDGSQAGVLPPAMTADERAEHERRDREANAERVRLNDAIRRDRNLVQRFPDEAAHNKARAKALEELKASVRTSEQRLTGLMAERKTLETEMEFNNVCEKRKSNVCVEWKMKAPEAKLKMKLDANDAGLEAQNTLIQNLNAESVRVNRNYDDELKRLRILWKTGPGSAPPTTVAAEPLKTSTR